MLLPWMWAFSDPTAYAIWWNVTFPYTATQLIYFSENATIHSEYRLWHINIFFSLSSSPSLSLSLSDTHLHIHNTILFLPRPKMRFDFSKFKIFIWINIRKLNEKVLCQHHKFRKTAIQCTFKYTNTYTLEKYNLTVLNF